jgi:hypothetical protein
MMMMSRCCGIKGRGKTRKRGKNIGLEKNAASLDAANGKFREEFVWHMVLRWGNAATKGAPVMPYREEFAQAMARGPNAVVRMDVLARSITEEFVSGMARRWDGAAMRGAPTVLLIKDFSLDMVQWQKNAASRVAATFLEGGEFASGTGWGLNAGATRGAPVMSNREEFAKAMVQWCDGNIAATRVATFSPRGKDFAQGMESISPPLVRKWYVAATRDAHVHECEVKEFARRSM